jgi:hypothetical protein
MTKQAISPDQFLEEMNKELRLRPQYQPGMRVVSVLPGTEGWEMSGYDLVLPSTDDEFTGKSALLSVVHHAVNAKFYLV